MTRAPEGLVLLRNPNDIDLERTYDIKRGPLHHTFLLEVETAKCTVCKRFNCTHRR